jgi:hypothetical protein
MQIDDWIELEEQRQARMRRLQQPRLRLRRRAETQVLGFGIPIEQPTPPAVVHAELLARIDAKVAEIHAKGSKHRLAGRRAALLADRGLAVEVRQLCVDTSPAEVLAALDISRQGLLDVWLRHDLKAPRHSYRDGGRP